VLAPIDLDNEACFKTSEISDVFSDRNLTPEFDPIESAITQFVPQPVLLLPSFHVGANGQSCVWRERWVDVA
jgi:hypothetical protein